MTDPYVALMFIGIAFILGVGFGYEVGRNEKEEDNDATKR